MELIKWSYTKRQNIKATFDYCPLSTVIFKSIRNFYFVYIVNWTETDPVITKDELAIMEHLLNKALGTENEYLNRKSKS